MPLSNPPSADTISTEWPQLDDVTYVSSGGQKHVYRAEFGEALIALKIVKLPESPPDPGVQPPTPDSVVLRLQREHGILHDCRSPNLVRIREDWRVQLWEREDGSYVVYAEDYIDGDPLDAIMPIGEAEACIMGRDMCSALSSLHACGYFHRDIKPKNIVLADRYVLLDPGIAFAAGQTRITETGFTSPGTPGFMSPEQCESVPSRRDPDDRTDIFSLAITIGLSITGVHPYRHLASTDHRVHHGEQMACQYAIVREDWQPSDDYRDALSERMLQCLFRMLARHRHERPRDVSAVRDLLTEVMEAVET